MIYNKLRRDHTYKYRLATANDRFPEGTTLLMVPGGEVPFDIDDWINNNDGTVSPGWNAIGTVITSDSIYQVADYIGGHVQSGWYSRNGFISYDQTKSTLPKTYIHVGSAPRPLGIGDILILDKVKGWSLAEGDDWIVGEEVELT